MLKDKVKLNPGEELKLDSSRTKGFMGEEDIDEYSILDTGGEHRRQSDVHKSHGSEKLQSN